MSISSNENHRGRENRAVPSCEKRCMNQHEKHRGGPAKNIGEISG